MKPQCTCPKCGETLRVGSSCCESCEQLRTKVINRHNDVVAWLIAGVVVVTVVICYVMRY
jgi:hypothetical protein